MRAGLRMLPSVLPVSPAGPCVTYNEVHYSRAGLGFLQNRGQHRCKHSMKYLNKVRGRSGGEFEGGATKRADMQGCSRQVSVCFLSLLPAPDEPGRSARCLLLFADVRLSLSQKFKSLSVR